MNLITIQRKYNTQAKCITYLEKLRWGKTVVSPFTSKTNVTKRKGTFKYHCNDTNQDFSVLYGTIFQDTRLPLPKWFLIIGLMINAKKGIASTQIARDLGISYKTAWYSQMRVRCAMVDPELELDGLLEMDEAFIGGKPRKKHGVHSDPSIANLSTVTNKRGRGTSKTSFVGIAEKKGKVSTKVIDKLSSRNMLAMLRRYVEMDNSAVITDGFKSYKAFDDVIDHITLTEKTKIGKRGMLNISTLDSFFSIVKKGITGNYVVISKKYLPFYLIEFQYKFNERNKHKDAFEKLMKNSVLIDKDMLNYKPTRRVRSITNPTKKSVRQKKKGKIAS